MPTPALSDDNALGPYRLLRKLGEGGMGTVHLAFDSQLERHVAIKLLRLNHDHSNHAALAKRFLREARSAAKLNHPHVVTIYSVGQQGSADEARPYLVMEYLEAGSLADQLHKSGPLPWRDAAAAISDALLGLAAAHHAGIIHRDIKPANLMRSHTGQTKLVDFGLARAVYAPADAEITFPGAFVGSPSYASPEQITASAATRVDARSDLYSLAATFYALLTGQPPFIDDDPEEIMRRQTTDHFPDPREFVPDIPSELLAFLAQASEKNPANRFIGASEMQQALQTIIALPVTSKTAPTPSMRPRPTLPPRLHDSVAALESQLSSAQKSHDTPTQITALRSLYGLYTQLDRHDQARTAFRQALALHIKFNPPATARVLC